MPRDDYRGEMDDFLALTLRHMNQLGSIELSKLSAELQTGLENNLTVFGEHAFRKHTESQTRRSVINASLWDVMSTGLSRFPRELVQSQAGHLGAAFYGLMEDDEFIASITYGTNDTRRVNRRFKAADAMFQEVLGAQPA